MSDQKAVPNCIDIEYILCIIVSYVKFKVMSINLDSISVDYDALKSIVDILLDKYVVVSRLDILKS